MPRRKLSEYRAKTIINDLLGLDYMGWEVLGGKVPGTVTGNRFVVKVDQAVKQRFKRGLLFLDVTKADVPKKVRALEAKGFTSILIEPFHKHDLGAERYINLRREREGVVVSYSRKGGVEIESHHASIKNGLFDEFDRTELAKETGFSAGQLTKLRRGFDDLYLSSLEINPYVIDGKTPKLLDIAIEVDSSAEQLVSEWQDTDTRTPGTQLTDGEVAVHQLNKESLASFSLEMINRDGGIFLLLSGGGASVVIADEIFTMGHGKDLANYGEYSGNPSEDETEYYTEQVVGLLLKSGAKKKVVLIGGAVANFTDIQATFNGIITVLRKHKDELKKQGIKFYVRRGGPHQAEGLGKMRNALAELDILGGVYDPSVSIPTAVTHLVKGLKS